MDERKKCKKIVKKEKERLVKREPLRLCLWLTIRILRKVADRNKSIVHDKNYPQGYALLKEIPIVCPTLLLGIQDFLL